MVYDGPVYVSNMTFFGYENVSNEYVAGAIGFKKLNKFSSSAASTFKNIKYGFIDEVSKYLYVSLIDDPLNVEILS